MFNYRQLADSPPPPLFWAFAEHFLRIYREISQNATKQRNNLIFLASEDV